MSEFILNKYGVKRLNYPCRNCGEKRFYTKAEFKRRPYELCRKCWLESNKTMENAANWKGGKFVRDGYVFIKQPSHPHANNIGYVREHRLVMEKCIGRILKPGEVVHHINGKRDDNRIENLVLCKNSSDHTKHHPKKKRFCCLCDEKHLARGYCQKHYWEHFLKGHRKKK